MGLCVPFLPVFGYLVLRVSPLHISRDPGNETVFLVAYAASLAEVFDD